MLNQLSGHMATNGLKRKKRRILMWKPDGETCIWKIKREIWWKYWDRWSRNVFWGREGIGIPSGLVKSWVWNFRDSLGNRNCVGSNFRKGNSERAYPFSPAVNCLSFAKIKLVSVFAHYQQKVQYHFWSTVRNLWMGTTQLCATFPWGSRTLFEINVNKCNDKSYNKTMYKRNGGPGSSVGIATAYGLDGRGIESRWGEIFRTSPDRPWGPPSLLYNGYPFPGVRWCRDVTLTPHPLLVQRSKTE